MEYVGEVAAIGVAVSWTISALFFETASKRIGSMMLNLLRLALAVIFLGVITLFTRGSFIPLDASGYQWFWLSLSGVVGFFLGDLCLFKSYIIIGARMGQLIMTMAPVLTAIIGFFLFGEMLSLHKMLAMALVLGGILTAMLGKEGNKLKFDMPFKGFLFAFGAALGQAGGFILSKKGMGDFDPVAATQIRAVAGFGSFFLLMLVLRRLSKVIPTLKSGKVMKGITLGTVFGPVIGVSLSLFALQRTATGIAATLMGLVPIFIILPSVFLHKQPVTALQIFGAVISVGGSALFFF